MRVLAVRQPWANFIFFGGKTSEIRTMNTNIRERIAIYASRTKPLQTDLDWLEEYGRNIKIPTDLYDDMEIFQRGVIIGSVDLFDCRKIESKASFDSEIDYHMNNPDWYHAGMYSWDLLFPHLIQPIDFKFNKGQVVWSSTDEVIA